MVYLPSLRLYEYYVPLFKMTKFNRNIPYNSLPILPPRTNLETTKVLRKTIDASRALAKLNGMLTNLPNPTLFLDTIHLQEAKASSEIENIITTNDDLYRSLITEWPISSGILKNISEQYPCQLDDPLPKIDFNHPAIHMMIQDTRSYLPDDILCKVDRAAMGVSLEVRTPFLDPEVIKLSASLPLNFKISNGESKWILRQILYKHVPQSIIDRPKSGFGIPIGIWLRGPLREWAEDLLSYDRISNEGFFNPDIVSNIWKDHISGRRDWTTRLWAILMFQAWYARQL